MDRVSVCDMLRAVDAADSDMPERGSWRIFLMNRITAFPTARSRQIGISEEAVYYQYPAVVELAEPLWPGLVLRQH